MATYRTVFAAKGATIALLVAGAIAIIVGGFLVVPGSALFGVAGAGPRRNNGTKSAAEQSLPRPPTRAGGGRVRGSREGVVGYVAALRRAHACL